MKKLIMMALMIAMTTAMSAQTDFQGPRMMHQQRKQMTKEEMVSRRVERMDKELNLTDKQKKEITAILNEDFKDMPSAEQLKAKREEAQKKREQMKARREATDKKIADVLTPEQQEKFKNMKQHRGGKGHGHHHKMHKDFKKGDCCQKKGDCCQKKPDCCEKKEDCCKK